MEFPAPAPGFDDPLGLLAACHERILTHCRLLERIVEHHARGELGPAVLGACAQVVRYFTTAARHHHEDEEQDLFPRLRAIDPALTDTLARLEAEHVRLAAAWTLLERQLAVPAQAGNSEMRESAETFCAAYRAHIDRENSVLLPAARAQLSPHDLARLAVAMALRRGVTLSGDSAH